MANNPRNNANKKLKHHRNQDSDDFDSNPEAWARLDKNFKQRRQRSDNEGSGSVEEKERIWVRAALVAAFGEIEREEVARWRFGGSNIGMVGEKEKESKEGV
ncbi:hypothetical protein Godav_013877 [Gossypium davidsonii]|uniref:Uncharacterized protein n=2 Tax=Gossypium TaxID=3633 RepID=A0A7J8RHW2_GOSDV|nr:hypothetical protein [Gossypium davidsonii]MBA0648634.1 hypothetical protein [Gossypium klotzschianum]